jgi:hypothetical protein
MEKYFFKIVDNIDFVWKVKKITSDPYKLDETDFGHFVCNQRQFVPYLFQSIHDVKNRGLLNDYKEILPHVLTDDNYYFDKTIGLLHKDTYWDTLFAVRHINCLNRMSPIIFRTAIEDLDCKIYEKLMACNFLVGQKIYETAYSYFKKLWEIDEYFSSTNLDTIDKFLSTIILQAVYIRQDSNIEKNIIQFAFKPSWDEEHGLNINLNIENLEATINE